MKAQAIILAPPVMEDVTAWLQINEDESLRSEIPMLNITSLRAAQTSLERWLARENDQSPYFLRLIRIKQTVKDGTVVEQVVGFIASMHYKLRCRIEPEPELFLSLGLLKPYRHKGIMPVAVGLLCTELKNQGFHNVGASVMKSNTASQRCLLKCGFMEVYQEEKSSIYYKHLD